MSKARIKMGMQITFEKSEVSPAVRRRLAKVAKSLKQFGELDADGSHIADLTNVFELLDSVMRRARASQSN